MTAAIAVKWTTVRGLGNSWPAKLSLVMPVIGYAIIFNSWAQGALETAVSLPNSSTPNIFWHLYFYYFGIFLFGVGSAIYYLFCSRLIQNYVNFQAYYDSESTDIAAAEIIDICNRLISEKSQGFERLLPIRVLAESTGVKTKEGTRLVMYLYYNHENIARKRAIIICLSIYTVSISLLLIPSLSATCRIARSLF